MGSPKIRVSDAEWEGTIEALRKVRAAWPEMSVVAIEPHSAAIVALPNDPETPWDNPPEQAMPSGTVAVALGDDNVLDESLRLTVVRASTVAKAEHRRDHRVARDAADIWQRGGSGAALHFIYEEVGERAEVGKLAVDYAYGSPRDICPPSNPMPSGGWTVGEYLTDAEARYGTPKARDPLLRASQSE